MLPLPLLPFTASASAPQHTLRFSLGWSVLVALTAQALVLLCEAPAPRGGGYDGSYRKAPDAEVVEARLEALLDGLETLAKVAGRVLAGLAGVNGLLLAMRANSAANSRWEAGSRSWASIRAASRSLMRIMGGTLFSPAARPAEATADAGAAESEEEKKEEEREEAEAAGIAAVEAELSDLLTLVPCFSLALLHQLSGRWLALPSSSWNLQRRRGETGGHSARTDAAAATCWNAVLDSEEEGATIDIEDPATLYAMLPPRLARRLAARTLSRQGSKAERSPPATTERGRRTQRQGGGAPHSASASASEPSPTSELDLSTHPESEREEKLGQNIDDVEDLARRAALVVDTRERVHPSNLAAEVLAEMQAALSRLHVGACQEEDPGRRTRTRQPHTQLQQPKMPAPLFAHCTGLLNTLSADLTEVERLRDTPMPVRLSSHLHYILHLQLVLTPLAILPYFLPSTSEGTGGASLLSALLASLPAPAFEVFSWTRVLVPRSLHTPLFFLPLPCLLLASATCGVHALAEGLAQPFGTGREKLPVPRWCAEVVRECREVRFRRAAELASGRG